MVARGLGAMPGLATWATEGGLPLLPASVSIQRSCLGNWFLKREFASQRQVSMPSHACHGCKSAPCLSGAHSSLSPAFTVRLWPKEEGYCSFQQCHTQKDEDRHLMLTKISNKEMGLNQISSHSALYYTLLLLSRKLYVHKNTNTQFCRTV